MIRTAVGENRPPGFYWLANAPGLGVSRKAEDAGPTRQTSPTLRPKKRRKKLQKAYKMDDRDDQVLKTEIDEIMKRVDTILEKIQQLDPGLGQTPDPSED